MVGEARDGLGRVRGFTVMRWRVLLGAALITTAAGGVVFAHRVSQRPPDTRYLVLTEQVAAGQRLEAEDLGTLAMELPEAVDAVPEHRSDEVLGRVAAHTLEPSMLLSESDLAEPGEFADPDETLVSVSIDPARLRTSSVAPGATVHVLGTRDGDTTAVTTARVVAIGDEEDTGLGTSGDVLVELAVADLATAATVTDAGVNGVLTLVLPSPGSGTGGSA